MRSFVRCALLLPSIAGVPAWASAPPVIVIVKRTVAPVVTDGGGVPGLAATSRAVTGAARFDRRAAAVAAYRAHVARVQADFEASVTTSMAGTVVVP